MVSVSRSCRHILPLLPVTRCRHVTCAAYVNAINFQVERPAGLRGRKTVDRIGTGFLRIDRISRPFSCGSKADIIATGATVLYINTFGSVLAAFILRAGIMIRYALAANVKFC